MAKKPADSAGSTQEDGTKNVDGPNGEKGGAIKQSVTKPIEDGKLSPKKRKRSTKAATGKATKLKKNMQLSNKSAQDPNKKAKEKKENSENKNTRTPGQKVKNSPKKKGNTKASTNRASTLKSNAQKGRAHAKD